MADHILDGLVYFSWQTGVYGNNNNCLIFMLTLFKDSSPAEAEASAVCVALRW